jgi:hypothetical protein
MSREFVYSLLVVSVTFAISAITPIPASAQKPPARSNPTCFRIHCEAIASKDGKPGSSVDKDDRTNSSRTSERARSGRTDDEQARLVDQAYDSWANATDAFRQCLTQSGGTEQSSACGTAPIPDMSLTTGFTRPGNGTAPTITPAQAGAIAVARLRLPTLPPGIGPSPELNPWKMAAVGYPLWLWPDGPTQVGPVSDSVAGLSVSLTAKVSEVSFRMGDGNTVTCPADSKRWTNAVQPGQESPTCGYAYQQPSLPKGNYTIAAVTTWDVIWTVNGQSGVIRVPAVQTAQLPVGELQVLVR